MMNHDKAEEIVNDWFDHRSYDNDSPREALVNKIEWALDDAFEAGVRDGRADAARDE